MRKKRGCFLNALSSSSFHRNCHICKNNKYLYEPFQGIWLLHFFVIVSFITMTMVGLLQPFQLYLWGLDHLVFWMDRCTSPVELLVTFMSLDVLFMFSFMASQSFVGSQLTENIWCTCFLDYHLMDHHQ